MDDIEHRYGTSVTFDLSVEKLKQHRQKYISVFISSSYFNITECVFWINNFLDFREQEENRTKHMFGFIE